MRKLLVNGWAPRAVLSFQEQHALSAFAQGKALFMRNWPYAWSILNKEDSALRGKVGIVPFIHKEGHDSAGTLGGWGLGVASGVKDAQEVWKFIAFATSTEAQKILHFRTGAVPSRRTLFSDPEILKSSPHYKDLYQIVMRARARPVHPDYPRISDTLQKHVSAVLADIEAPEQALSIMHRSIQGTVRGEEENYLSRLTVDYDLKRTILNTVVFTGISGVSSIDVTLWSLSLGDRDTVTGWREKSFSESTIEMIVLSRSVTAMHLVPGMYARLDAVGRTRDTLEIGDEIETAANVYYEVKTIRNNYVGDLLWFRDCDLAELPLHE